MLAKHFLISGLVQGVGFRHFVVRMGRELGLKGWTRNLIDGRVEVIAEGEEEIIQAFAAQLRHGPPRSRVDAMEIKTIAPPTGVGLFEQKDDGIGPWQES